MSVPASSIERMSACSSRSGSARRAVISSPSSASTGTRTRSKTALFARWPPITESTSVLVRPTNSSSAVERLAQALVARAEDGAHDDLERQLLRAQAGGERRADRPARDLLLRDRADHVAVGLHALAVERGQQRLAVLQVLLAVEQQHAARAEQRLEDVVALARVQHVRVAGEDLLDVVGVTEHHPRRALLDVDGEDVAVAVAHAARVRAGAREPADRLREMGARRTGRKAAHSGFAFGLGFGLGLGRRRARRPALPRSRRAARRTGRGRSPSADHARSSAGRCDVRHVRARARRARGRARRRSSRPRRSRRPSRWGGRAVPPRPRAGPGPPHRRVRACAASPARGDGRGRARRPCRRAGA